MSLLGLLVRCAAARAAMQDRDAPCERATRDAPPPETPGAADAPPHEAEPEPPP